MKHRVGVIITSILSIATVFGLSACGTTTLSSSNTSSSTASKAKKAVTNQTASQVPSTSDTNDRGYVYQGLQSVIYIQWTSDSSGNITGQFQEVYKTPNAYTVNVDATSIKGIISGSNVSITLDNTGHTFTGNLSGSNLTLNVPSSDGMLHPLTFTSGSVNQYNIDAQQFKASMSQQQAQAKQSQAEADLFHTITYIQNNVQQYHDATTNPKHYYPTFFAYGNSAGTVSRVNQPNRSYSAEIDLNAIDNEKRPFGVHWGISDAAPWETSIPKDGEYFGVTANGIVFATSTPPDTQPEDATLGLNQSNSGDGNSGDGGWSNNNIQVYVTSGTPNVLKTTSLSSIEQ
jgi:hypothetical protein